MATDTFGLKAILSAVDKMSPVLKDVARAAQNTKKYLGDVGTASGKVLGAIGLTGALIGTALGGLSLNVIKDSTVAYADWAGSVIDSSRAAGLAGKEFQRLAAVADREGAPVEAFTASIGQLNKRLALAAAGKNQELAGLMKQLGIDLRGANGEIVNGADLLPQLADAFQKNENAALRARMGNALFGKSWEELLPMLADGSDGLAQSLARIDGLHTIFSDDDLKAADAFSDQLKDLSYVTTGFQNIIANELVPVLSPVIEEFIQWGAANKELIASEVKRIVVELVAAIRDFDWKGFVEDVKGLVTGFLGIVDAVGGAKNALIGLFILMNMQGIMAVAGLMKSIVMLTWNLGAMAVAAYGSSVPAIATLGTTLTAANFAGMGLLKTLGAVTAAFAVGYAVGTGLNAVIDKLMEKVTGEEGATLGGWLHDKFNGGGEDLNKPISLAEVNAQRAAQGMAPLDALPGQRPSAIVQASAAQNKVNGKITIDIPNAPPGTKVTDVSNKSDVALDPKVGYRSIGNPAKNF